MLSLAANALAVMPEVEVDSRPGRMAAPPIGQALQDSDVPFTDEELEAPVVWGTDSEPAAN